MFAALVNGWIQTKGLEFTVKMEDVETLNTWAEQEILDVTKMSFHRSLFLPDTYRLLSSGAALGNGCGPLVIAKKQIPKEVILKGPVALPGEWTTAHLLFKMFYPEAKSKQFYVFSEIENLVANETVVAGVIIHENRFTYESKGLVKILDLGESWEKLTDLPIPLGGIFASRRIDPKKTAIIESLIKESIKFAWQHPEKVMPYVRQFSQEMDEAVMKSHIDLYVNDFSLDLGEKGLKAVKELKKMLG